ncbi:hemerythrin domain-containing protein [Ideonella sp. DXS22W]|uniref:Hemerythrin domain-containing protein n=1 Tax=Pseudaquabacterium inlustre TaxID=2984192 RepID=A0ABU9CNX9_9BURK
MAARTARAARPARTAPPPLPPLEALDRTHHEMMGVLVDLTHLVDHLENHGVDAIARKSAKAICAFFTGAARQHHADEEALIFPVLIRKGDAQLTQHVLRLQQDHGWLEEDWLELAPQLQAVAEGYSWYELDALRHGVGVFTTLYHEHIALEESLIYPEAKRAMAAEAASRDQRVTTGAA